MTPLERAGKALYERDPLTQDVFRRDCLNPASGFAHRTEPLPWEELGQDDRDAYVADARAVIDAVHEPSEEMAVQLAGAVAKAEHVASDNGWQNNRERLIGLAVQARFVDVLLGEAE